MSRAAVVLIATVLAAFPALPQAARAQSCYGYPDEFGVYPQAGYQSHGDGVHAYLGGLALSATENVALRVMYARSEFDDSGAPAGAELPKGNGIRFDLAATPDFAFGRVCWVTAFRLDWYGDLDGETVDNRQVVIGPSLGYGAGRGDASVHFFVSPQIRFVGANVGGQNLRDDRWAVEGGVGLGVQRVFTRVSAVKVEEFDEVQFEVVLGGWIR